MKHFRFFQFRFLQIAVPETRICVDQHVDQCAEVEVFIISVTEECDGAFVDIQHLPVCGKGDDCVFEKAPLEQLVKEGQLMSYVHEGFWQCMDNIREKNMLEKLLETNTAPWKKWEREVPKSLIL